MDSIILVGMPGAGKSTLGLLLAKHLAKDFVDTDLLIQNESGQRLQTIIDEQGYLALRELEARVLLKLKLDNCVVATGGSAVYSDKAMAHLKAQGKVVYLKVSLAELQQRITNLDERGLARRPGQDLASLHAERVPLYERCADIVIHCDGKAAEEIVAEIAEVVVDL